MEKFSLFALIALLLIYSTCFVLQHIGSSNGKIWEHCPLDWIKYSDEKCFKIVDDTLRTFADTKEACASQEHTSTLASIHSREEQNFLTNYLFKVKRKVDNFWICAKVVNENPTLQNYTYVWVHDNSALHYTNWDTIPRNRTNYCVHMQADETVLGKWKDGKCFKKNAVVCQRLQFWSTEFMQKTFLNSRKDKRIALDTIQNLTQSLASANQRIDEQKQKWDNVELRINELKQNFESASQRIDNLVPIGFIYVQLPYQSEPGTLWPTMQWRDVYICGSVLPSSRWKFTRIWDCSGGKCSTGYRSRTPWKYCFSYRWWSLGQNYSQCWRMEYWDWCLSSHWNGNPGTTHKFFTSGGEVRPRNMAVRIWKREH